MHIIKIISLLFFFFFTTTSYGQVRKETIVKTGELLGAQFLISGAVTEFDERVMDAGGLGIDLGFGIGVGAKVTKAHVAVDVRMYDTTTGQITFAESVKESPHSIGVALAGVDIGRLRGIGGIYESKTPLGKAVRNCIKRIVGLIIKEAEKKIWHGRIVKIKDEKIYLNFGQDIGIKAGTKLDVFKLGEEMIDPETGLSLGAEETKIGTVRILEVKDKFSIASSESGGGFERGQIVRLQKEEKKVLPKKRVAVVRFENRVPRAEWDIGDGMAEMLITELVKTKKFIVLERKELDTILAEQELGAKRAPDATITTPPTIYVPPMAIPTEIPASPLEIPDISPDEETVSTIPEFSWPEVQGVRAYRIMVDERGGNYEKPVWSVEVPAKITKIKFGEVPVGGKGVKITTPLKSKTRYQWMIMGLNEKNEIIAEGEGVFKTK